jgi:hypothetical protein
MFSLLLCLFSNNSSTVACVFVDAGMCLQSRCLAIAGCLQSCSLGMDASSHSTILDFCHQVKILWLLNSQLCLLSWIHFITAPKYQCFGASLLRNWTWVSLNNSKAPSLPLMSLFISRLLETSKIYGAAVFHSGADNPPSHTTNTTHAQNNVSSSEVKGWTYQIPTPLYQGISLGLQT